MSLYWFDTLVISYDGVILVERDRMLLSNYFGVSILFGFMQILL